MDEEHETSYKQEEAPRYQARDVAVVRGKLENCVVLLGSATPSLESYHNASSGKYQLLNLTLRVDDKQMPLIRIIDLREEKRKAKALTILAEKLHSAIVGPPGKTRTNDPVSQSPRLLDLVALQRVRRSAELPELQRGADLSSHRRAFELPSLRAHCGGAKEMSRLW